MDLSFAVNDPLTAESFQIQRSNGGYYGAGGWSDKFTTLNLYGRITLATAREIEALPEADRTHESIVVHCELPMYVTRLSANDGGPATSDIAIYHNQQYRIVSTNNYASRGYWWAIAVRMMGA
jgi:hypothetical protein